MTLHCNVESNGQVRVGLPLIGGEMPRLNAPLPSHSSDDVHVIRAQFAKADVAMMVTKFAMGPVSR